MYDDDFVDQEQLEWNALLRPFLPRIAGQERQLDFIKVIFNFLNRWSRNRMEESQENMERIITKILMSCN